MCRVRRRNLSILAKRSSTPGKLSRFLGKVLDEIFHKAQQRFLVSRNVRLLAVECTIGTKGGNENHSLSRHIMTFESVSHVIMISSCLRGPSYGEGVAVLPAVAAAHIIPHGVSSFTRAVPCHLPCSGERKRVLGVQSVNPCESCCGNDLTGEVLPRDGGGGEVLVLCTPLMLTH